MLENRWNNVEYVNEDEYDRSSAILDESSHKIFGEKDLLYSYDDGMRFSFFKVLYR